MKKPNNELLLDFLSESFGEEERSLATGAVDFVAGLLEVAVGTVAASFETAFEVEEAGSTLLDCKSLEGLVAIVGTALEAPETPLEAPEPTAPAPAPTAAPVPVITAAGTATAPIVDDFLFFFSSFSAAAFFFFSSLAAAAALFFSSFSAAAAFFFASFSAILALAC